MTAKEVARVIGVSPSTVSMVINNRPGISASRRAEIIAKIKELDCAYLLKETAVGGRNIGFVVYKNSGDILGGEPFFPQLMESVSQAVRERGHHLLFMQVVKDGPVGEQVRVIQANQCTGLIIFATEAEENDMAFFRSLETPFVILDNDFSDEGANSVCINNRQGILAAMRYLHRLGHRRIGYIRSKAEIYSFRARHDVYRWQMARWDLPIQPGAVVSLRYSQSGAGEDMREWLRTRKEPLPTAFLADNDILAFGAVWALRENGLRVPEDVSVIGFDDQPICTMCEPQLSTVAVPRELFGPAAIGLLEHCLKDNGVNIKLEVGVRLVVRESTCAPRKHS